MNKKICPLEGGVKMANAVFKFEEEILIVSLSGEVTLLQSNELKEKIKEELTRINTTKLVLDLSQVPLLDSSGLGMLISLFKHVNQKEGIKIGRASCRETV